MANERRPPERADGAIPSLLRPDGTPDVAAFEAETGEQVVGAALLRLLSPEDLSLVSAADLHEWAVSGTPPRVYDLYGRRLRRSGG